MFYLIVIGMDVDQKFTVGPLPCGGVALAVDAICAAIGLARK
jgi:hypothetical protein